MGQNEKQRETGKTSLENAFRKIARRHVRQYGLEPEDIEHAASTIMHEVDGHKPEAQPSGA